MLICDQTIPDRSRTSKNAVAAMDLESRPIPKETVPARHLTRVWLWATLVLVVSLGVGATWFVFRGRTDPDSLWADAERAFLAGQWDRASKLLQQLERLRPSTGLDWLLEAQLASAQGHFANAFSALAQISDSHAIAPQAHLMAGRLHRQLNCLRKAEASFRQALKIKPDLIDAHKEMIYILGIQSRRREVDAEFHELARLTQLTHHDLFTWALTHFTEWNPDIVDDLDRFIRADPDDRYSRLAVVELLLERPEAESYIEQILAPLPHTDPDAIALRINLALNLGKIEEAEALLVSAPANHPRISRIRGEMALRHHEFDGAIKHFQNALSAEPYDRVSPMQLAQAFQLKGDKASADAYVDRVKRLNRVYNLIVRVRSPKRENEITDLAELGKACEEAGLNEEASGWYILAITIDALDASAQQGLSRIGRSIVGSSR
jgi:tetratricopeptide (TPR) repeat protein